ncbi:MAG TPA: class I SAM-dependent methyltransferase [Rhizomicrobium sp.]|nr:class I SAM-dependent methyltransferase [Rhizomicrobium sp.]
MGAAAAETIIACQGHEGPRVTRAKGYDVIACQACGFRHVVPLPEPAALESAYRETYYADEKPTFLAHAGEDQAWAQLSQDDRLDVMEALLPRPRRRLLDIGSGPGFFLKTAKNRFWQVMGIEPSRQAAAHARDLGVEVTEGFFNAETAAKLGRFDAVHLNNVLEHVPDPANIVTLAHGLLEPGGVICTGVPNDFSPLQIAAEASGLEPWWVQPPHHLNYFDFDSLQSLLEKIGFTARERLTSFPMEAFLLMGDHYTSDPALGRACHTKRKRFDMALESAGLRETRRDFYRALAGTGLGREAVIIATKP